MVEENMEVVPTPNRALSTRATMSSSSGGCTIPLNLEVETTESLTPVAGHICVSYRGCLICWGGYCYDEREIHYRECNWLYIFPYTLCGSRNNVWLKVQCETDLQLRPNSGATAGIHQDKLYIFGGCLFDDLHRRMINTSQLLAIDLRTGALRLTPAGGSGRIPTPRDKTTSWIAHNKFYIFGGYGMSWHRLDQLSQQYFFAPHSFLDDDMGSCWNNQLLAYCLRTEQWEELEQFGKRPSQRAAAASIYVPGLNQVFLFGGRHDQARLNDLYMLDLATLIWTQIDTPSSSSSPSPPNSPALLMGPRQPEGRSWCTMSLLGAQKKILCYGGLCSRGQPLNDLWELDIAEFYEKLEEEENSSEEEKTKKPMGTKTCQLKLKRPHWRQIPPLEHQLPTRLWHCAALMDKAEAVLFYGGMNEAPSASSPFVRTLLVKRLRPATLQQMALNAFVEQIIREWTLLMDTAGGRDGDRDKSGTSSRMYSPNSSSQSVDLQSFANSAGFMAQVPHSLHAHVRTLLSIRKHAKVLNPTGGSTPRGTSPYRWLPSPINFHLLNFDGIRNGDEQEEEEGDHNHLGPSFGLSIRRGGGGHRNVPLSPKSQKRALADELVKQICELARGLGGGPFLQALFHAFDPL